MKIVHVLAFNAGEKLRSMNDRCVVLMMVGDEGSWEPNIIWVGSYPKSGNTWTRIFLSNILENIAAEKTVEYSINSLARWSKRDAALRHYTRRLDKPIEQVTAAEIAALRPEIQASIAREAAVPIYVKTHNAVARVEGFPTINFDVTKGAIYLVRNPLDVAISYSHHLGISVDETIEYMADPNATTSIYNDKLIYEFMSSWSLNVASWFSVSDRPVLIVRYEDMINAPQRTFGRIISFLGLEVSDAQLNQAIENASFGKVSQQEAKHGFIERPTSSTRFFRSGKIGQWKTELSQAQITRIIQTHSAMMMRCGYLSERC